MSAPIWNLIIENQIHKIQEAASLDLSYDSNDANLKSEVNSFRTYFYNMFAQNRDLMPEFYKLGLEIHLASIVPQSEKIKFEIAEFNKLTDFISSVKLPEYRVELAWLLPHKRDFINLLTYLNKCLVWFEHSNMQEYFTQKEFWKNW
jgi:hypothetical protein